jgi:hypothetical protein
VYKYRTAELRFVYCSSGGAHTYCTVHDLHDPTSWQATMNNGQNSKQNFSFFLTLLCCCAVPSAQFCKPEASGQQSTIIV